MSSLNFVILVGRLGKDPELRTTQSGDSVCYVSLATDRGKRRDGEEIPPDWHNVVFFGKTADTAAKYLVKGSLIGIEGRIHYEQWKEPGTDIVKRYTKIHAHVLRMLGSRPSSDEAVGAHDEPSISSPAADDEEAPF